MEESKPVPDSQFPVHDLILHRWSGRSFSPRAVPDTLLHSLFEAARWSASSYNEQPWYFICARTGESAFENMLSCLTTSNQEWVKQAPVLILTVAKTIFSYDGRLNRHAMHDVGLAIGNFSLQATGAGLNMHQLAGFDDGKAKQLFALPEHFVAVTLIALGFRGEADDLPPHLLRKELAPQVRKPIQDFVFRSTWGNSFFESEP